MKNSIFAGYIPPLEEYAPALKRFWRSLPDSNPMLFDSALVEIEIRMGEIARMEEKLRAFRASIYQECCELAERMEHRALMDWTRDEVQTAFNETCK